MLGAETMNKQQFVDRVTKEVQRIYPSTTKKAMRDIVDTFFNVILVGIKEDGKLSIPALGTFKLKQLAPRTGRNPHTGEAIQIPAKCSIGFKPTQGVKEEVTRDCLQ
jgi:DNA-binding protein HU-beta